jgi:peptidoglycan/xylan/chitin deacetylase (PgdA/CDA1 family)
VGAIQVPQVRCLIENGHEIGCHTYSHLRTGKVSWQDLEPDLEKNQAFFSQHFAGYKLENFSYPGGSIGIVNKRHLSQRFNSLRGNFPRLNTGRIDLNTLAAVRLYSPTMDRAGIDSWLRDVEARQGWLILYTHDIGEDPSPVGCTPDLFEYALKAVRESSCEVKTIKEALLTVS